VFQIYLSHLQQNSKYYTNRAAL